MKMGSRFINLIALSTIAGNSAVLADTSESDAATAFAKASATIVSTVTISKTADHLYATLSRGGPGGTVMIPWLGTRSATGDASLLAEDPDDHAATFKISGGGNDTYVLTLPPNATIKDASSADIAVHTSSGGTVGAGVLNGGSRTVTVVGILSKDEIKVAGNYSGSFNITVDYN